MADLISDSGDEILVNLVMEAKGRACKEQIDKANYGEETMCHSVMGTITYF